MMVLCPKCDKHVEYYESKEYKESQENLAKLISDYEESSKAWDKSDEDDDTRFWLFLSIIFLLFFGGSFLGVS
ncbi:MAG: hypothetical protein ACTSPB_00490 [Candidatus Thorarchaeota archaeon]